MKLASRYLYVSGMSTGIIMAMVSLFVILKMIPYMDNGGSFLIVVLSSLVAGLVVGGLITFALNRIATS